MKSIALALTMMLLLAVASLSMAFSVTVNVPGQEGGNDVYQTVEMQPLDEQAAATADAGDDSTAQDEPLVAENE